MYNICTKKTRINIEKFSLSKTINRKQKEIRKHNSITICKVRRLINGEEIEQQIKFKKF